MLDFHGAPNMLQEIVGPIISDERVVLVCILHEGGDRTLGEVICECYLQPPKLKERKRLSFGSLVGPHLWKTS